MTSRGSASVISEEVLKGQDSLTTDRGQSVQPEERSATARAEHTEKADDLPQQADDLSFSLDELNVTSSPEASAARPNHDYNLVNSLLNLTRSPVSGFQSLSMGLKMSRTFGMLQNLKNRFRICVSVSVSPDSY